MNLKLGLGVALACALSSGLARAADAFDTHVANIRLLQAKEVQADLGVTEGLRKKLNVLADAHTRRLKDYEAELRRANKDLSKIRPDDPRILNSLKQLNTGVLNVLSASQLKRLRELTLQQTGVRSFLDPEVSKRLGLNAAQKKKLETAFTSGAQKAGELQQRTFKQALGQFEGKKPSSQAEADNLRKQASEAYTRAAKSIQPELKRISNSTESTMLQTLTAAQRSSWATLKGRPFKGK